MAFSQSIVFHFNLTPEEKLPQEQRDHITTLAVQYSLTTPQKGLLVDLALEQKATCPELTFAADSIREFRTITKVQLVGLHQLYTKKLVSNVNEVRESNFVELTKNYEKMFLVEFMQTYRLTSLVETKPYLELAANLLALLRNELALQQKLHPGDAPKTHEDFVLTHPVIPDYPLFRLIHHAFPNTPIIQMIPDFKAGVEQKRITVEKVTPEHILDTFICALMNLRSYLKNRAIWLHETNYLKLFFTSFLLTAKMENDRYYNNEYHRTIFEVEDIQTMNRMEEEFFKGVGHILFSVVQRDDEPENMNWHEFVRMQFCLKTAAKDSRVGFDFDEFNPMERTEIISGLMRDQTSVMGDLGKYKPAVARSEMKTTRATVHSTGKTLAVLGTPETKQISEAEKAALDQKKKQIEEALFSNIDKRYTEKFNPKATHLTKLEFALLATLKDSKSDETKKVLVAIQECRAIERRKGTPEEDIRPYVNFDDTKGLTPLCHAMRKKDNTLVMELLKADADPCNASYERFGEDKGVQEIPLVNAILYMPSCMDAFLEKKPDINAFNAALNLLNEKPYMLRIQPLNISALLKLLNYAFDHNMIQYPEKIQKLLKYVQKRIVEPSEEWTPAFKTADEMIKKLEGKKDPVFKPKVFWDDVAVSATPEAVTSVAQVAKLTGTGS